MEGLRKKAIVRVKETMNRGNSENKGRVGGGNIMNDDVNVG